MRTTTKTTAMRLRSTINRILTAWSTTVMLLLILAHSNSLVAQESVWGMTAFGGSDNFGTIYKTSVNGENQQVVYEWTNNENYGAGFFTKKTCNGIS